jgi:hypothetical protein
MKPTEAPDRLEAIGVGAIGASRDGQDESVVNDIETDAAAIEGESGSAVLAQDAAESAICWHGSGRRRPRRSTQPSAHGELAPSRRQRC